MAIKANRARTAFTLVELMVTILVIVIMSGFLITALSGVRETARQMRTQQFIMRLNTQVLQRYNAFRTRPLPVNPFDTIPPAPELSSGLGSPTQQRAQVAWFKLWGMRSLMAMEMPDGFGDLLLDTPWLRNLTDGTPVTQIGQAGTTSSYTPSLTLMYMDHIRFNVQPPPSDNEIPQDTAPKSIRNANLALYARIEQASTGPDITSAECLYMIVEASITDRDLHNICFNDTDVGDVNRNGLPEFIDAWGNPILFCRWPAGFVSDMQPSFKYVANQLIPGSTQFTYGSLFGDSHPRDPLDPSVIVSRFPVVSTGDDRVLVNTGGYHDAFDPMFIDRWEPSLGNKGDYSDRQFVSTTPPDAPCNGYNPPAHALLQQGKNFGLPERSYNISPLIVSAGVDGDFNSFGATGNSGLVLRSLSVSRDMNSLTISSGMNPYLTVVNPYLVVDELLWSANSDPPAFQPTGRHYQRGAVSGVASGSTDNIHNQRIGSTTGL